MWYGVASAVRIPRPAIFERWRVPASPTPLGVGQSSAMDGSPGGKAIRLPAGSSHTVTHPRTLFPEIFAVNRAPDLFE